jgi:ectoine hydroxylase-related dioxygenase (phytanoyl-CoA dioxygenase family)
MTVFETSGFSIFPDVLAHAQCDEVIDALAPAHNSRAGSRNLLKEEWCRKLATAIHREARITQLIPTSNVAVQCTLFEKTADTNWLVSLHQDLSIPVRERIDSPDCAGWSEKEGAIYVQPPVSVLQNLTAVRVHLDDSDRENGPLRVVPGSHRYGRLTQSEAAEHRSLKGEFTCLAQKGGAVLLRPLLLHASSKSNVVAPRRVLHFLYGPPELPFGLHWSN